MKSSYIILLIACLIGLGLSKQTTLIGYPTYWPKPVYNFKNNPLTSDKILLGKVLFYDPILSLDSTISCASCHSPYTAFTHVDHALSHGINDRIGKRNAPAVRTLGASEAKEMAAAERFMSLS